MSRMAHDFFTRSPLLSLPVLAMILFGLVFAAIVIRTLRATEGEIDRDRALPLEEDRHV